MKLLGMFQTFAPRSSTLLKVVGLNVLLLAGAIIGVNIHQFNMNMTASNDYSPVGDSFIDYQGTTYWISQDYSDNWEEAEGGEGYWSFTNRYYISYLDDNQEVYNSFIMGVTGGYTDLQNRSFVELDLLPLGEDQLGVWVTQQFQRYYYNDSLDPDTITPQDYTTEITEEYYLLGIDTYSLGGQEIVPSYVLNVTTNDMVDIGDFKVVEDQAVFLFKKISNTTQYSVFVGDSHSFGNDLRSYAKEKGAIGIGKLDVRENGANSYFEDDDIVTFNVDRYFTDLAGKDEVDELPRLDVRPYRTKGFESIYLDKQQRIHVVGDSLRRSNVEGNYTGENSADYVMYDPATNSSHYWDLFPTDSGGNDVPRRVQLLQVSTTQMAVLFLYPSINGHYTSTERWDLSPDFDDDYALNWSRTEVLQVGIFNPVEPTVDNYIQFNQSLSQTEDASITYPRLYQSTEVPGTFAEWGGGAYSSNYQFLISKGATGISLYYITHQMENGEYTRELWGNSIGRGLVRIDFSLAKQLEIDTVTTVMAPEAQVDIDYSRTRAEMDYETEDFSGFQIFSLYHVSTHSSGAAYIFMSSYYSGTGIVDSFRETTYYGLHIMEVEQ